MAELATCPFCGSQPEEQDVGSYFVMCPSCGMQGPFGLEDGAKEARKAWNHRAAPADAPVAEPVALTDAQIRACMPKPAQKGWIYTDKQVLQTVRAVLATRPPAPEDAKDAARWRYVMAHWSNCQFSWNKDAANSLKTMVLTMKTAHQSAPDSAEAINREIDAALSQGGGA